LLFRETAKQAKRAAISQNFLLVSHPFCEMFRENFAKIDHETIHETSKNGTFCKIVAK
jgi:hypothetical protein